MMPGRSGLSLCRAIKTEPDLAATPVILLTARAGFDDTLHAYAHGADDFVAKPFHPRILVARVNAQLKLRAMSAQLAQREKLAAVGSLAAGILHEVRNPLNALLSATRTLSTGKVGEVGQQRLLAVMQDAGERIHALTWTLDAHARPAERGGPALCDLAEGLDSTLRLMQHRLGGVEVLRDFQGQTRATVQPAPINQVFVNLLDNAIKAAARHIWLHLDATGPQVRLVVEDDGHGIPPEILPRIFDAFYTTASPGQGTGLGLYLSRDIVERAGGSLVAQAREGGGARFTLVLPGEGASSTG
jgi:signal transduction histidine kinase